MCPTLAYVKEDCCTDILGSTQRHQANPPLWARGEMHQPILGLDTAPRPLRLMVWACLDRPWSLPPPEPRVRPLVGHFRLASKGT